MASEETPLRCFVAVPLPGAVKEAIAGACAPIRAASPKLSWTKPENYHLTLRFLGDTSRKRADRIVKELPRFFAGVDAFELRFGSFGTFGPAKAPKVLWIGVDTGFEELRGLERRLSKGLARGGIPPEKRPFRAHLTVARVRRPEPELVARVQQMPPPEVPAMSVSRVVLMRSILLPQGARYEEWGDVALTGAAGEGTCP